MATIARKPPRMPLESTNAAGEWSEPLGSVSCGSPGALNNDLPFEAFVEPLLLVDAQLDIGTKGRVEGLEFVRMPLGDSQQPLVALAQAGLDIAFARGHRGKDTIAEYRVAFVAGRHNDQEARGGKIGEAIDLPQGDNRIGVVFGCGNVATVKTWTGNEGEPVGRYKGFRALKALTGIEKIEGMAQDMTVIGRGQSPLLLQGLYMCGRQPVQVRAFGLQTLAATRKL